MAPSRTWLQIVAIAAITINGVEYPGGTILGACDPEAGEDPTLDQLHATADGVTRGHLQARLRVQQAKVVGAQIKIPGGDDDEGESSDDDATPYDDWTVAGLKDAIAERNNAGRNIQPDGKNKAALIAALVDDDEEAASTT